MPCCARSREIRTGCRCRCGRPKAIRFPIWKSRCLIRVGWPNRWLGRYGFDAAEAWEQFNNAAAPLTIRVNRLKTDRDALVTRSPGTASTVEPARYAPDGLIVTRGNPLRTPLAGTGQFFLQDEASQLVALLGAPEPGMKVLDTCASPGGKTTAMAAMAGDRAEIVAADVRSARVQLLRETVSASGAQNIRVLQADLEAGLPFAPEFDVVFVDAPCSGLGTVRRDPDIRWRRAEADLAPLATRAVEHDSQRGGGRAAGRPSDLLHVLERAGRKRGRRRELSCRERQLRTDRSASRQTGPLRCPRPGARRGGVLRTSPHEHGLEAFYGAVLRRVK